MAFNKVIEYGTTPNFLESAEGLISKTFTAEQTNAVEVGGRKIIKAGSVFPKNETDAKAGTNAIKVSGSNGNYVVDSNSKNTVFESAASIDGKDYNLHLNGLAEGTYYLVETKAPDGFNKLTAPVVIKITKSTDTDVNNWAISKDGTDESDKIIDIENSTGSLLPSTGGAGVIVFAGVAILLVFGVAVSFIRDKRKAC